MRTFAKIFWWTWAVLLMAGIVFALTQVGCAVLK